MGWLEAARRANLAEHTDTPEPRGAANVDEDDDQLAAYNAYLARINGEAGE
jgi:hypothetical protein